VRIDSEETPIRDAVTTLRTIETGRVIAILRGDVGIPIKPSQRRWLMQA
jgi:hypothetical protein